MECVVLLRMHSGRVTMIHDESDEIEVFATRDEAQKMADKHPLLQAVPYQIVELTDL